MMFTAAGWIIGLLLIVAVFAKILDHQNNPNQSVATLQTGDFSEIVLKRGRNGHYVFNGKINQHEVTFLVDTGASITAIPGELQRELELERGPASSVSTANGVTTAYLTRLDRLSIGEIEFTDVNATLIPGMGVREVLLGMNVLKHFELVQRGDQLIIRHYR
jgi:aspartyl protease family protein